MYFDPANSDVAAIILVFISITLALLLIIEILILCANKYISQNRGNYQTPLTQKCYAMGIDLQNRLFTFHETNRRMGFQRKYNCSSSIVAGAQNDPIKYLIKYTNLDYNEESLYLVDDSLRFIRDITVLKNNLIDASNQILDELPFHIRIFSDKKKLPYILCDVNYDLSKVNYPVFIFSYTSPKGKAHREFSITITEIVLEKIELELQSKLSKKEFATKQRSLMTNDLRNAIKKRDNYTCKICGNSVFQEPNLLLEVDHIVPIAQGGKTEANNLQTLCWRCNRNKGDI